MRLARSERLLLCLVLLCSLVSLWQLALQANDNQFADGICAAATQPERPPEERALQLFHWVSHYDDPLTPAGTPAAVPAPRGPRTPRQMVEHREYFRANCGSKAWLLAVLARRSGLNARELRLCDANHVARHVVCEIWVNGAWRVFDPTSRLDFRRADGQLATARDLREPALLAANAQRAPEYDARRWTFTHAERLHFEKLPLIGAWLRRLAPRVTGRPAEELAIPFFLELPRLVAAGSSGALGLFLLGVTGLAVRRRARRARRTRLRAQVSTRGLAINAAEQD
jgi:hypothetical protein